MSHESKPSALRCELRCPVCRSERFRFLYSSPAGKDTYARAAELPPDSPITSHFCFSCGVIFNSPRFLEELAANVYSKNLPVHPHGMMNFRKLFNPHKARLLSPNVIKEVLKSLLRHLKESRGVQLPVGKMAREVLKRRREPLESRLDRDFGILQSLLGQAGRIPHR